MAHVDSRSHHPKSAMYFRSAYTGWTGSRLLNYVAFALAFGFTAAFVLGIVP